MKTLWTAVVSLVAVVCVVGMMAAGEAGAAAGGGGAKKGGGPEPMWIWGTEQVGENQTVYLRKSFEFDWEGEKPVSSAKLTVACDDEMVVHLNGVEIGRSGEWKEPVSANVAKALRKGVNVLAVEGKNRSGAGGLVAKLEIVPRRGHASTVIVSDGSWQAHSKPADGWREVGAAGAAAGDGWVKAAEIKAYGEDPWGWVLGDDPSAEVVALATPAESMKVLDGFKVELVYSVPRSREGSWVAMCTDTKGRLIVSDQQGGIFRVDPDASPVEPELIAVVPEGMKDAVSGAQGLCWAFDSLYVVVSNGKPVPGLYRLRDTNGDDKLDHAELLRKLNGGGEHGPHAVVVAPDGSGLYVASGNHTHLPDLAGSKLPLPVAEDQLLPRMWDANGHAVNVMAPGGWICHVTPDGKEWTLVSAGYRNQYDIAFNHDGELFTFDSDMEWDIGLPWYRPTRVNHATSGSEFGWRSGSGKWPEYSADSLGAVVNVGPGSPTGVLFGYGAKFPAKYQNAFFIHDWSFGRIFAVHLTPDGSSYTGQLDRFITARPLPVTDMVIRPNDGALYFTTGGRGTQSGLYRVTYIGSESTEPVKHVPDAGQQARLQRHALEAFHGKQDPAAIDAAWPQLASPDRYMRYAARVAIEHQPVDQWASRALSETNPAAAIESLIALIHRGDKSLAPQIISALDRIAFDKLSEFHQLALLRAYGLTFIRMGNPDSATAARLGQRFAAMIPAKSTNLNMELARIVAFLQPADGPARLLSLLDAALTQEEQIHYVYCLRTVTVGWTPALRQRYFSWFASASQFRGGASFGKFLVNIRNEALAAAPEAMRDELKKLSDAKAQAAAPVAPVAPRPFVKNYTVDDLLPLASAPMKGRNFERGRAMYAVAQCAACHRLGTTGGSSGPDLTGVGGRMGPRDLLEAIIEPSKVVSDQYEATIFTLKGGNVIMGRIVNLSGDTLRINTNVFDPGSSVGVKQSDIVSQMVSPASLMPPGLLGTLTEEEVLDLLAYMISGGNPQDDMFR